MTQRRWRAVFIALITMELAVIILSAIMADVRGYEAQGSETLAAGLIGIITWWAMDIRAVRADRMERRRKRILARTRK